MTGEAHASRIAPLTARRDTATIGPAPLIQDTTWQAAKSGSTSS
ncbi:marR-family transcriptional regulator domain protein [Burkholderia thailandensis]|uniref:MarR-family transcriptional regulator domain protein n=1 Tax=Burkholderia thailandensis TaxID=57975 RepID=A0AAW9D5K1_BURTH|nr:marR-family transcriptional regulator domain protein [Burkholderia thailandensis]MDW9257313.1 marR-family transcriptional regulator domain protein [Burkholderia thailandensis]